MPIQKNKQTNVFNQYFKQTKTENKQTFENRKLFIINVYKDEWDDKEEKKKCMMALPYEFGNFFFVCFF